MQLESSIKLGVKVKDKITGFEGIVTGLVEYLTGCAQCLVQPPIKADNEFVESRWFDIQRLSVIDAKAIQIDNGETPGSDKPAPRY